MSKRKSGADQSVEGQIAFRGGANNDIGTFVVSAMIPNTNYTYDGGGALPNSSVGDTLELVFTTAEWQAFFASPDYQAVLTYMTKLAGGNAFTALPLTLPTLHLTIRNFETFKFFVNGSQIDPYNPNAAPVIDSNAGGATAGVNFAENDTALVTTVHATDAESDAITYSIVAGGDGALFDIASDGKLSFKSAPNFESPGDSDANNTYIVTIRAADAFGSDTQTITVTVTGVNEFSPVISSNDG
jgi:hypothetical protein